MTRKRKKISSSEESFDLDDIMIILDKDINQKIVDIENELSAAIERARCYIEVQNKMSEMCSFDPNALEAMKEAYNNNPNINKSGLPLLNINDDSEFGRLYSDAMKFEICEDLCVQLQQLLIIEYQTNLEICASLKIGEDKQYLNQQLEYYNIFLSGNNDKERKSILEDMKNLCLQNLELNEFPASFLFDEKSNFRDFKKGLLDAGLDNDEVIESLEFIFSKKDSINNIIYAILEQDSDLMFYGSAIDAIGKKGENLEEFEKNSGLLLLEYLLKDIIGKYEDAVRSYSTKREGNIENLNYYANKSIRAVIESYYLEESSDEMKKVISDNIEKFLSANLSLFKKVKDQKLLLSFLEEINKIFNRVEIEDVNIIKLQIDICDNLRNSVQKSKISKKEKKNFNYKEQKRQYKNLLSYIENLEFDGYNIVNSDLARKITKLLSIPDNVDEKIATNIASSNQRIIDDVGEVTIDEIYYDNLVERTNVLLNSEFQIPFDLTENHKVILQKVYNFLAMGDYGKANDQIFEYDGNGEDNDFAFKYNMCLIKELQFLELEQSKVIGKGDYIDRVKNIYLGLKNNFPQQDGLHLNYTRYFPVMCLTNLKLANIHIKDKDLEGAEIYLRDIDDLLGNVGLRQKEIYRGLTTRVEECSAKVRGIRNEDLEQEVLSFEIVENFYSSFSSSSDSDEYLFINEEDEDLATAQKILDSYRKKLKYSFAISEYKEFKNEFYNLLESLLDPFIEKDKYLGKDIYNFNSLIKNAVECGFSDKLKNIRNDYLVKLEDIFSKKIEEGNYVDVILCKIKAVYLSVIFDSAHLEDCVLHLNKFIDDSFEEFDENDKSEIYSALDNLKGMFMYFTEKDEGKIWGMLSMMLDIKSVDPLKDENLILTIRDSVIDYFNGLSSILKEHHAVDCVEILGKIQNFFELIKEQVEGDHLEDINDDISDIDKMLTVLNDEYIEKDTSLSY